MPEQQPRRRGGRPSAGRKRVVIFIKAEMIAAIDELAAERRVHRSAMIELVLAGAMVPPAQVPANVFVPGRSFTGTGGEATLRTSSGLTLGPDDFGASSHGADARDLVRENFRVRDFGVGSAVPDPPPAIHVVDVTTGASAALSALMPTRERVADASERVEPAAPRRLDPVVLTRWRGQLERSGWGVGPDGWLPLAGLDPERTREMGAELAGEAILEAQWLAHNRPDEVHDGRAMFAAAGESGRRESAAQLSAMIAAVRGAMTGGTGAVRARDLIRGDGGSGLGAGSVQDMHASDSDPTTTF